MLELLSMEIDGAYLASHRPVARSRLAADLRALGVEDRDHGVLMVHCRVSALGYVVGGAQTVVGALLDALGPTGTLMAVVGWREEPRPEILAGPPEWRRALFDEQPAYDPARSEAHPEKGRTAEAIRLWPGATRSAHPEANFAAIGPRAAEMTDGHELDYAHGPNSPTARLVAAGGQVLNLAAPLETMTLLHQAEAIARVPDKRTVEYEMPILVDGVRTWKRFADYDTNGAAYPYESVIPEGKDEFAVIVEEMLASGIGRSGRVGEGAAHLFDARAVVEFGVEWIERHFG